MFSSTAREGAHVWPMSGQFLPEHRYQQDPTRATGTRTRESRHLRDALQKPPQLGRLCLPADDRQKRTVALSGNA